MKWIRQFEEIGIDDIALVGGKNASLGEMIGELKDQGVAVPEGFAVTAEAYKYLLQSTGIDEEIKQILSKLNVLDMSELQEKGKRIRSLVRTAKFPQDLRDEIVSAYTAMCEKSGHKVDVAVRSSATAEDLPDASFAGLQQTFLHITGKRELLRACSNCFASLFTNRAISYREEKRFSHLDSHLSIGVQRMVRSDSASAGVMFTLDTQSGFRDVVLISASYGLGESVVQGAVAPDEYYVFKTTLKQGKNAIIRKHIGAKTVKMIYGHRDEEFVRTVNVAKEDRGKCVLSEEEIIQLAKWACIIEDHYSSKAGHPKPMDIEWAKDGDGKKIGSGELFILQARPETVHSRADANTYETYVLQEQGRVLCSGRAIGQRVGRGTANCIASVEDIGQFRKGNVLITAMTSPDWEPIMKLAAAIVTNKGGRTCHAAIISRELGVPCITGTGEATEVIRTGQPITVACCEGLTGNVYDGFLKYEAKTVSLSHVPSTKTAVMLNLGIPEKAFSYSSIPCAGVGLARIEFILNSYIGIHPLALLNYEKLRKNRNGDNRIAETVKRIEEMTSSEPDKPKFFIDALARGVGRIAAAFHPKPVVVRFSDFKSSEYANLVGGYLYEPQENNPMIGWRGASRYYDKRFKPAFELECKAILKARQEMGLTNIKVMIPFCRTPEEGREVIDILNKFGLVQGKDELEVYMMAEIPSNVIMADEFAKIFDGFSIGSNDLTQLTLGLDRDSELVSHIYSERSEPVKRMIRQIITEAKKSSKKVGICGQAPSDFPDFTAFLVECGIDSISLNPDTAIKTALVIADAEKQLGL
jgi:pyruvate,water dikinase